MGGFSFTNTNKLIIFIVMEDIIDLTKDYFNKTTMEKEIIQQTVLSDILLIIRENELNILEIDEKLNKIIKDSSDNEDYEISELFLNVKKKVKNYYGL
jgi:hypothetical protein